MSGPRRPAPVARPQTSREVRKAVALEVPARPMDDEALFEHLPEIVLERSMLTAQHGSRLDAELRSAHLS